MPELEFSRAGDFWKVRRPGCAGFVFTRNRHDPNIRKRLHNYDAHRHPTKPYVSEYWQGKTVLSNFNRTLF